MHFPAPGRSTSRSLVRSNSETARRTACLPNPVSRISVVTPGQACPLPLIRSAIAAKTIFAEEPTSDRERILCGSLAKVSCTSHPCKKNDRRVPRRRRQTSVCQRLAACAAQNPTVSIRRWHHHPTAPPPRVKPQITQQPVKSRPSSNAVSSVVNRSPQERHPRRRITLRPRGRLSNTQDFNVWHRGHGTPRVPPPRAVAGMPSVFRL